ncbi:SNF2L-like protein [Cryptosporidium canis]|uniref:SNF2L-like protein n=1 Tax=Cryptosporidium canis TaxID=195482 RepID=A0ABQ8PB13_9CRYT|nr:SNF2L-like protein [Cryptosporidium canis]KAJ1615042.1 SNF2L-like protein [Cryptosporidium canis]
MTKITSECHNEAGNSSPMSLEDPDEPSPSPINPITLKHTLRLASRVSISNDTETKDKYFDEYPNSALLTELGETLNAISVNEISSSPSPKKSFKIPNDLKKIPSESKIANLNKNAGKNQRLIRNNRNSKHKGGKNEQKYQEPFEAANLEEIFNNKTSSPETKGIQSITQSQNNAITRCPVPDQQTFICNSASFGPEMALPTPTSPGSNRSFDYSKWIKKESIKDIISKYIPRFLLPALEAIERLRIRFAIPTKRVKGKLEIHQKKERVKKIIQK